MSADADRPLRVGIDAHLLTYRRGIGNWVHNLVHALAREDAPHEYVLYASDPAAPALAPRDPRFTVRVLRPAFVPVWEQVALPRAVRRDRLDVLYCPANTAPMRLTADVRLVLTAHDVMFLLPARELPVSPSAYQRFGRRYYRLTCARAARRARIITTVSAFSRDDIARRLGLPETEVRVIHNAPGAEYRRLAPEEAGRAIGMVRARLGVPGPYVLALGAIDPRKNTGRVLEAFARFRAADGRGGQDWRLVVCGMNGAGRERFGRVAEALGVAAGVVLTDFVNIDEMVALYNGAEAFLYPSLYEGFGLPVVEAMACGAPVITSERASLPEVAGDAALYADPLDPDALSEALARVVGDAALRERLVSEGFRQERKFTWERAARAMIETFEQAAGRRPIPRTAPGELREAETFAGGSTRK